jgi:hypothetical protein
MLRPIRLNSKLLDPVKLQQVVKYQGNLTVTSNDTNVVPRDEAGNVQLQEESETNPLLIIEPVATKILLQSVLKVLDTRFQYFKFPATTRVIETDDVNLDLTLPELDEIQPESDIIYARYRPSENREISVGSDYSGILMDFVEDGVLQKAANNYQITKEIKNSGKDLRFRFNVQHIFQSDQQFGTAYFSIIKNSPTSGLQRRFKEYASVTAYKSLLNTLPNEEKNDGYGYIKKLDENGNERQDLTIDVIILNSEFEIGDYFGIGAVAGQPGHTIRAIQTYWSITDASKNVDEWNQEIS